MYVYQQIVKADIEYLENSRVTEITHDWLNFGYEFVSSRSVSNANQKACINLLRKLIEIKSGSRIKVSELNKVINEEIKVSSQVIKQLIQANFDTQTKLYNGYDYWIDLGWKEANKKRFMIFRKDNIISLDKMKNITDDEALDEENLTLIGRTLTMNNEQIEAFVEVLVPIIEERINKGNYITYYRRCL